MLWFCLGFVIGVLAYRRHIRRHIGREVIARYREYEVGLLQRLRRSVTADDIAHQNREVA